MRGRSVRGVYVGKEFRRGCGDMEGTVCMAFVLSSFAGVCEGRVSEDTGEKITDVHVETFANFSK